MKAAGSASTAAWRRCSSCPSARHLVPLTDLDPVDAAPLTDAALTPYHAIKRSLDLLVPGSTALVIGAGGLGHMAIQILDGDDARADRRGRPVRRRARSSPRTSAPRTACSRATTAADEVRELTKGRGTDLVLDFVGVDATIALAAASARPLSDVTLVGIGMGTLPVQLLHPAVRGVARRPRTGARSPSSSR